MKPEAAGPYITRVEVIDSTGRVYSARDVSVDLVIQDEGRTLKLFIKGGAE